MPFPCLKPRRSSKVFPAPNASLDVDLVEVRKGRVLRIQHINPRMRNKQLPQAKQTKPSSLPPVELRVPKVNFYGNKCVITDPNTNENNVRNGFNNKVPASSSVPGTQQKRHVPYEGKSRSNVLFSGLSKDQKRMLFKMGIRSASALKNIVLFFFHGVGGSSDIWQTQISYFSSLGFEIVAPDLIGHGMSEIPLKKRAYHFREILADVLAIFDRYCKKKNLIIGHSYGCAFTTVLARERARRVWRLIMISGGGPIPLAPEIGIFALPLWIVSCIRPCLDQVFEKSAFKTKQKNEMLKRASFNIPSFVLHYVINGQDWPEGDEVYHSWISVPTLLINGRDDAFATLEDAKLMKATIHGSKLEIVDEASHMVMLEAPDKVNKLILEFICSRGSHKLPDVKELAEEGIETPQRSATDQKQFEPEAEDAEHSPSRRRDAHNWTSVHTEATLGFAEERERDQEQYEEEEEEDDDKDKEEVINRSSPSARNTVRCKLKKGVVTGYDNASYEYEESEDGYYIYRDQYGQSHYASSEEFHELFDKTNSHISSSAETKHVNIPSFEDVNIFEGSKEAYINESKRNERKSSKSQMTGSNILTQQNSDNSMRHREEQNINSLKEKRPSVMLALGRQRSDSLDYLGEEELIIITSGEEQGQNTIKLKNTSRHSIVNNSKLPDIPNEGYRKELNSNTFGFSRSNERRTLPVKPHALHSELVEKLNAKLNFQEKKDVSASGVRVKETHSNSPNEESIVNRSTSFMESRKLMEEHFSKTAMKMSGGFHPMIPPYGVPRHSYISPRVSPNTQVATNSITNNNSPGSKESSDSIKNTSSPLCRPESVIVTSSPSFLQSKKALNDHFSKIGLRNPHHSPSPLAKTDNSPKGTGSKIYPMKKLRHQSPDTTTHSSGDKRRDSKSSLKSGINEWAEHQLQAISEIISNSSRSSKESSPSVSPSMSSPSSTKGTKVTKQMSLRGWAEKHLTLISEYISPPATPDKNKSRKSSKSSSEDEGGSNIEAKLKLSQWAEKHIQLISEGKPNTTSPQNNLRQTLTSSGGGSNTEAERNKTLSVCEWAERHARRVSSIASNSQTELEMVKHETETRKQRQNNNLSLSEWAERHARKVSSMSSYTPPTSGKASDQKPNEVEENGHKVTGLSVGEWAARHARRVSLSTAPSEPNLAQSLQEITKKGDDHNVNSSNLSLSEWAERHARRVSGIIPHTSVPPESDLEHNKNEVTNKANNQNVNSNLSVNEWAERHAHKVSSMASHTSSDQKGIKYKEKEEEQQQRNRSVNSNLSLNEWAERHARKVSGLIPHTPPSGLIPHTPSSASGQSVIQCKTDVEEQTNQSVNSNLSLNEWAERHARKVSMASYSSAPTDLEQQQQQQQQQRTDKIRKKENQSENNNLSLSEWAEKHARKVSSMASKESTSPTCVLSHKNDDTLTDKGSSSTIKSVQENSRADRQNNNNNNNDNLEIKPSLVSEVNRNLVQVNTEEKGQKIISNVDLRNESIMNTQEYKNNSTRTEQQSVGEKIYEPNVSNSQGEKPTEFSEDPVKAYFAVLQPTAPRDESLPQESISCESNVFKLEETSDTKCNEVRNQTGEVLVYDGKDNIQNESKKCDSNSSDKKYTHSKVEEITENSCEELFSNSSELCRVKEIPHLSNTDLSNLAEKHFQKILDARISSDSVKECSNSKPSELLELQEPQKCTPQSPREYRKIERESNETRYLTKDSVECNRVEIISKTNQDDINQNVMNTRTMTQITESKNPDSESDTSSDTPFESCFEHFPESTSMSLTNEMYSQSLLNDTDDMISVADISLNSDILAQRFFFDDNSNLVDSDTDIYSDQFHTEEISIRSHDSDTSRHESLSEFKQQAFTSSISSNSSSTSLSTNKTINPNENKLVASRIQTSENSQHQTHRTEQSVLHSNNNHSPSETDILYRQINNSDISQQKHTHSFESGFNDSNSSHYQTTSSSSASSSTSSYSSSTYNNEDITIIAKTQNKIPL